MPSLRHLPILALTSATLAACGGGYEPKPQASTLNRVEILSSSAALRNAYVVRADEPLFICAEPSPDAAFSQEAAGDIAISLINLSKSDEDGDESEQSGESEMAGRTPSVMLARELMFRLCEFSRNHHVPTPQAIELYKANLQVISEVARTAASRTTVMVNDTVNTQNSTAVGETFQIGAVGQLRQVQPNPYGLPPAPSPYGTLPSSPYGAMPSSPYGAMANPYGAASPYGTTASSPYAAAGTAGYAPTTGTDPNALANPFPTGQQTLPATLPVPGVSPAQ